MDLTSLTGVSTLNQPQNTSNSFLDRETISSVAKGCTGIDSMESMSSVETPRKIFRLRGGLFLGDGSSSGITAAFRAMSMGVSKLYHTVWSNILYVYDAIWYNAQKLFGALDVEMISDDVDVAALQRRYLSLGSDQWKENIDAYAHNLGKHVFDYGLHGGCSEPGFLGGIYRGQHYVYHHLGQKTTPDMMMSLHKVMCAHFKGTSNNVLMGWEKVGVFRDIDDHLSWHIINAERYEISDEARADLAELEVADFQPPTEEGGNTVLRYRTMSRAAVKAKIQGYLDTYYEEISVATTRREKLTAIGKFFRNSSWTHTTRDGSGRLDMMILQKHLCENGLPGAFLEYPYRSSTLSLEGWVDYLEEAITSWENAVAERNGG